MGKSELINQLVSSVVEIAENLAFILKELPGRNVPAALQNEVASACWASEESCYEAMVEILNLARHLRVSVFDNTWSRPDARKTIRMIQERVESCTQIMHPVVRHLEVLKSDSVIGTLYILVAESTVNMLSAAMKIGDQLQAAQKYIPPEFPGSAPHPLDNVVPKKAMYRCSICNAIAGVVVFSPSIGKEGGLDSASGLVSVMGVMSTEQRAEKEQGLQLLQAIESGQASALYNADPLRAPFYCPGCKLVYCKNHLLLNVKYDEGFYDATYVTCPRNHTRMIDD